MSHTPGPWTVETLGTKDAYVRMGDGKTLARFGSSNTIGLGFENAYLIAAAPDLLAALKAVLAFDGYEIGDTAMKLAEAAIAKAESGT